MRNQSVCLTVCLLGIGCFLALALTSGCSPVSSTPALITQVSGTRLAPTIVPTDALTETLPAVPVEHRIGIRVVGGVGEFYDRQTGAKFVPRGNNYVRLAPMVPGSNEWWHSTLNPGYYDASRADDALRQMSAEGYNTVRVFVDCCRTGNNVGDPQGGLAVEYLDNLLDFLNRARSHGIFVQLDLSLTSADGGYNDLLWGACNAQFQSDNCRYMTGGGVEAKRLFVHDLVQALIDRSAPLDYVFAYQIENEMFFDSSAPPLTLSSGVVRAANGQDYDLALPQGKEALLDDAVVYYIDTIRREILNLDPTALVTIGFFPPNEPNPWSSDERLVKTRSAVWQSTADFIDFHPYPGGYGLVELVENFGMAGADHKPIIMGEYGAARYHYSSAASAAMALHDWQVESCSHGFDGWLLWTWDGEEQWDFYNGLTEGGLINQALAPVARPDPCQPGSFPFFERNIALGMQVRASRSQSNSPPTNAVNGDLGDQWSAGDFPVQWIEIDLGNLQAVRLIRLHITQSPAGNTVHQIWMGADPGVLTQVKEFRGLTDEDLVLEWSPDIPGVYARYIRVVTRESPSWVGWNEIEVIGD